MKDIRRKRRLIVFSVLTGLIMLAIFLFSAQDGEHSGSLSHGFLKSLIGELLSALLPGLTDKGFEYDIRKYAHMFEYFCLGISAFLMFREIWLKSPAALVKTALSAEALGFLYACSDELHQLFVPGRAGRFQDVMIDSLGLTAGVLLFFIIFSLLRHFLDKGRSAV